MGFRAHIPRVQQNEALKPVPPPKGHYFFAGQTFPRITWYKDKNLRRLYFYILVLILTNTANGMQSPMLSPSEPMKSRSTNETEFQALFRLVAT
jgi:hypothetical protein